ncbi:MAG: amino acid adenylation domain-containing protein [Mycobacteriales bacterium]
MSDSAYPCHFGRIALRQNELYATFFDDESTGELADALRMFLAVSQSQPQRRMALAAFRRPEATLRTHAWYAERFWSVLQALHDVDGTPWNSDVSADPDDPSFEFVFAGVPMFVFAGSPTHALRTSRNLGDGMVLLFQPRNVFRGFEGGTPAGTRARQLIRDRLAVWDAIEAHPDMGDYGDPSNHEWRQYFIADDSSRLHERCPLRLRQTHGRATEPTGADPMAIDDEHPALLHELFEQRVDADPTAVALSGDDTDLTYAELDAWANQVAHRLLAAGVGPESKVAVLAERRIETAVAILGVLKAGAGYVPVDPAYPAQRFRYVMTDSAASVVVCPASLLAAVPAGEWAVVQCDRDALVSEPPTRPALTLSPDAAAYIIYTSGSTGEPKGVVVTHGQIVHSTLAHFETGRPFPASFLLLVSFSFDASAVGLWWTLSAGGQVVVPSRDEHRDARALRDLVARHRVTHLDCTPALYSVILNDDASPLSSLRCVIVGGEACPRDLVERHFAMLSDCLLVNNYGPTETTVWATTADLAPGAGNQVPIGRAIAGATATVLDSALQPVAAGEVGELYIGGPGVARGYHERPALTADRFVPDPWSASPGARMYRTGDRARELPDGSLEFCGRVDHQVKVRGFRIELGEVEAALREDSRVDEAVADVHGVGTSAALWAWVTPATDDVTGEDLRTALESSLPAHLVPAQVVVIAEMPRNVAGKVDRSLLPQPELTGLGSAEADQREMTQLETEVSEMVAEVMAMPHIGVNDDLFELGGTSLHIARLGLAIWSRFQVSVPIHPLFQLPSVAGIAQIIEAARRQSSIGSMEWTMERLEDEAELAPLSVEALRHGNWMTPRRVLVTGATGYLGAFLVRELADRTDAELYCLVRAADEAAGFERVRKTMETYLIWDETLIDRIHVVCGDLAEPGLGLAEQQWAELARSVDSIYHSGALVNFLYPYTVLKAPNVDGTAEILRLAATSVLKAVHYISTIDVFLQTDIPRPYLEDEPLVPLDVPEGYARSKWVADHVVRKARDMGVPCCIYRPGMMISHTDTGATQDNDYLLVEIKGLLEFGVVPEANFMFDAIPIDFASKAIAHISLQPESLGHNFHLWNLEPAPVEDVFNWIRSFGYILETVPVETAIQFLVTLSPSNPLFPLMPLFLDEKGRKPPAAFHPEVVASIDFTSECRNTLDALAGSGITCPRMTEELAHKCFQYLVDVGFFPDPEEQRARMIESEQVSA